MPKGQTLTLTGQRMRAHSAARTSTQTPDKLVRGLRFPWALSEKRNPENEASNAGAQFNEPMDGPSGYQIVR